MVKFETISGLKSTVARLSESATDRWHRGGRWAARFRVIVKRRLRREVALGRAHYWSIWDFEGKLLQHSDTLDNPA